MIETDNKRDEATKKMEAIRSKQKYVGLKRIRLLDKVLNSSNGNPVVAPKSKSKSSGSGSGDGPHGKKYKS